MNKRQLMFGIIISFFLCGEKVCEGMAANVSFNAPALVTPIPMNRPGQHFLINDNHLAHFVTKLPFLRVKHTFVEHCLSQLSFDDALADFQNQAAVADRKALFLMLADNLERMGAFLNNLYVLKNKRHMRRGWIPFFQRTSSKLLEYLLEGSFSWADDEADVQSIQILESSLAEITEQAIDDCHSVVQKLLVENLAFFETIEEFIERCPKATSIIVEAKNADKEDGERVLFNIASSEVSSMIKAIFDLLSSKIRHQLVDSKTMPNLSFTLTDSTKKRSLDSPCKKNLDRALKDYEWMHSLPGQEESPYLRDCNHEVWIGESFFLGKFVEKDQARAKAYFKKAAHRIVPFPEQARAFARLGEQYLLGKGTKKNPEKGFKYLNRAAEQKKHGAARAMAQLMLGEAYVFGDSVEIDYKKALDYFKQVAAQKDSKASQAGAWSRLADLYWWGMGVKRDAVQVRVYSEKIESYEIPPDYEPGIYQRALAWQRLGDINLQGDGVPTNHAKANAYFTKAMQQNSNREARAHAWLRMGEAYLYGQAVPRDGAKAFELLTKAVSQQDSKETQVWAQLGLGTYYYMFKRDMAKADKIFKKVAAQTEVKEAQKTAQEFLKPL